MKDLLGVTGYIRGACSPIGMKKKFPAYIDSSSINYDFIYVSAGKRGLQIRIKPDDLIRIADMKIEKLVKF
jgi:Cys-tRNA(Pro)/Cys-tRNA(Cys) deacylase